MFDENSTFGYFVRCAKRPWGYEFFWPTLAKIITETLRARARRSFGSPWTMMVPIQVESLPGKVGHIAHLAARRRQSDYFLIFKSSQALKARW